MAGPQRQTAPGPTRHPLATDLSRADCSALTTMRAEVWAEQLALAPAYDGAAARRLLDGILYGVDIGFTRDRSCSHSAPNAATTRPADVAAKVDALIQKEVDAGFKRGPFPSPPFDPFWVSPLGAVPKGLDKIRLIHNLSHPFGGDSINAGIPREEYRMETFMHAIAAIRRLGRGTLLTKADVEAAFKRIPVRPEDWPLLGMQWRGMYYYEVVLPFGLRTSGYRWEEYAAALHYFFERHLGVYLVIHYVDDFLLLAPPGATERAAAQRRAVEQLCCRLGVPLAADKTLGPVTELTFLGLVIDTAAMEYRLADERVAKLRERLAGVGAGHLSLDELMSLVGKLEFAALVMPVGRAFLHRIRAQMLAAKDSRGAHRAHTRRLNREAAMDAQWWLDVLLTPAGNRRSIIEADWVDAATLHIHSDACDKGYGAYCGTQWIQGTWSGSLLRVARVRKRISMPFLELYSLTLAAITWGEQWRGKRITFHCDAQAAVAAVQNMRSRRDTMSALLRLLFATAARCGFEFRCVWLKGATNTVADLLSRVIPCPLQELRAHLPRAEEHPTPSPAELPLSGDPLVMWVDPVSEALRLQRRRATSAPRSRPAPPPATRPTSPPSASGAASTAACPTPSSPPATCAATSPTSPTRGGA